MKETLHRLAKSFRGTRDPVATRSQPPRAPAKRILVVDDNQPSREGLRVFLLGTGAEIETAADAWQAISKIKDRRFDVAILDLDLPPVHGVEMSGWDLVRILRAYSPTVAIIVVSAESADAARAEAQQLRIAEFLEKPISLSRLKAAVQTLMP